MSPPKTETPKKETPRYDYRVLLAKPIRFSESDRVTLIFVSLGTYNARTPDEAIEAAGDADVLPDEGGTVIAVPMSRWNERHVQPRTIRLWEITKPQVQLQAPAPHEPDEPPFPDERPGGSESPSEAEPRPGDSSVAPGETRA